MHGLGPYIVGVAFWAFLSIAAVAGIVSEYKKRRIELEPLRAAIERGQPLDPAIVERLTARPQYSQRGVEPLQLRLGGVIVISVGAGIAVLAVCLRPLVPVAFYPMLGGAGLLVCIGIGLWIGARLVERYGRRPAAGATDAVHGPGV
ncbi:MAG TPA: hypothetical protein VMD56_12405 [Steroidobacteraceae bacterium]|nr:hypothetical protein [Steroidobacteraceae bacterium]